MTKKKTQDSISILVRNIQTTLHTDEVMIYFDRCVVTSYMRHYVCQDVHQYVLQHFRQYLYVDVR